jgi:hypothetical protein
MKHEAQETFALPDFRGYTEDLKAGRISVTDYRRRMRAGIRSVRDKIREHSREQAQNEHSRRPSGPTSRSQSAGRIGGGGRSRTGE